MAINNIIPHHFQTTMFNKSILAAALLTVGAITAGTAASAAEIGVRNTWGTSNRNITHGQSWSVQGGFEQYSEESAGFAVGVVADDFSSEGLGLAPLELNATAGSVFGPGGSIVNRDAVIENDPDVTGIDMFANDAVAGDADAAGARSGDASTAVGAPRSGNARADAARGGDATVAPSTGNVNLNNYDGGSVTQTAEAGVEGYGESLNITGGLNGTPTAVDGRLGVSGSGYVRSARGFSAFAAGESYSFSGNSNQGFSELSTFSR